jgi:hypothetical protein
MCSGSLDHTRDFYFFMGKRKRKLIKIIFNIARVEIKNFKNIF